MHITLPNNTPANAIKVRKDSELCKTDEANYTKDLIKRMKKYCASTAQVINIDTEICGVMAEHIDNVGEEHTLKEGITICFDILIENKWTLDLHVFLLVNFVIWAVLI